MRQYNVRFWDVKKVAWANFRWPPLHCASACRYIFLQRLCCLSRALQSSRPYKDLEHRPVPLSLPPSLHPCPPLTSIWSGSALVLDLPPSTSHSLPAPTSRCHFCINKWSLTITLRPQATLLHFHPPLSLPCLISTPANRFFLLLSPQVKLVNSNMSSFIQSLYREEDS